MRVCRCFLDLHVYEYIHLHICVYADAFYTYMYTSIYTYIYACMQMLSKLTCIRVYTLTYMRVCRCFQRRPRKTVKERAAQKSSFGTRTGPSERLGKRMCLCAYIYLAYMCVCISVSRYLYSKIEVPYMWVYIFIHTPGQAHTSNLKQI